MSDNGLYNKYTVTKDDEPVSDCFGLEPDSDLAARAALETYADTTDNDELAADLRVWVSELEFDHE